MPTARRSLALSLVNVYETLAISLPTVVDAVLHRVEKKVCDDRLEAWARKVIEHARIDLAVVGRENMQPGLTYLIMTRPGNAIQPGHAREGHDLSAHFFGPLQAPRLQKRTRPDDR